MRDEINAVTEVLRALGDGSQASRIEALAQTPDSTNLCVGVAGEVNRGKTTLIDALLGAEVLRGGDQRELSKNSISDNVYCSVSIKVTPIKFTTND